MEIRMAGVTKTFGEDITALEDVFLNVPRGDFVYLVGPTGSGKTTLLRILNRELLPTRGQALVGEYNLRKLRRTRVCHYRRAVGMVFQDYRLLEDRSALENVAFVLEAVGASRKEAIDRAGEVLDCVGMWRRRFLFPRELSGGEQQRVSIARSIANDPLLLLCDEPTGNLDPQTAGEIMQLLLSINASGTTLLMATHNRYLVDAYRQRVVELKMGRIVRDQERGRYEVDEEL